MRIHPLSFVLGLGVAGLVPLFSRVLRPLAVEAAAAGMGLLAEGRRVVAEQMETLEDIAAEARARRADIIAAAHNGHPDTDTEEPTEAASDESATAPRARRRPPTTSRRRTP
jgi:hypothetical protein